MSLSGSDPHGLTQDEAAAIHVYTQESPFYRVLNEHLRGTDRSKIEPYKPCACLPRARQTSYTLQPSATLTHHCCSSGSSSSS
jgi:hypothetical protein